MCVCVCGEITNNISFARKCMLVPSRFGIYRFSAIGRDNIIWKWRADAIRMPSFRPCWNVHSVVLNEYTSILRSAQSILNMRSTYLPIFSLSSLVRTTNVSPHSKWKLGIRSGRVFFSWIFHFYSAWRRTVSCGRRIVQHKGNTYNCKIR